MSRHSRQPAASVWHTYAMLARRVERPCCLIIRIGQNCPKIPRILYDQGTMTCSSMVPPALRAPGTAGMRVAPSVASLGVERLANHGMELRTPLITASAGRYQGAPALIPAVGLPP